MHSFLLCTAILFTYILTTKLDVDMESYYSRFTYPHVYDISHHLLPNLESYAYIPNVYLGLFILYLITSSFVVEFIGFMVPILIARMILMHLTVLPKTDNACMGTDIWGGCYDKIFSGHFSIVFLITLLLWKRNRLSMPIMVCLNGINAFFILATRAHYTIDIVVSILVTLYVVQNKLSIPCFHK